jgi:hypothetical protein
MDFQPNLQRQNHSTVMTLPKNIQMAGLSLQAQRALKWAFIACYTERAALDLRIAYLMSWTVAGCKAAKSHALTSHLMTSKVALIQSTQGSI